MRNSSRDQVLATIAAAVGAVLLASLWMHWAQVGFDPSAGMLSGIETDVTGWEVHDILDIVLAGAAAVAILANATLAAGNRAVGGGPASLLCGIVSGGVVAWTMIEPPVPEFFEVFNAIPGVPDLQFDPSFGLFVALGASVGLILLGVLQLIGDADSSQSVPAAPGATTSVVAAPSPTAPRPPDPFAKPTPPPPSAPPRQKPADPFVDPVTGEPTDH